jgi:hypothetical protein
MNRDPAEMRILKSINPEHENTFEHENTHFFELEQKQHDDVKVIAFSFSPMNSAGPVGRVRIESERAFLWSA